MTSWIKVSDQLPKHKQQIIFYVDIEKSTRGDNHYLKLLNRKPLQFKGCGYAHIEQYELGDFLSYVTFDKAGQYRIYLAEDDYITHWHELPDDPEE